LSDFEEIFFHHVRFHKNCEKNSKLQEKLVPAETGKKMVVLGEMMLAFDGTRGDDACFRYLDSLLAFDTSKAII